MTNHWVDIKNTDLVLIMGGNAAEAHPCGFKWVTEAIEYRKAKLIVVDPRFTRSAAIADVYAPIRVGTDIAFLAGVINYMLANNKYHAEYVKAYTNAAFLVKEGFDFKDGLFSGYDTKVNRYDRASWMYELGTDGYVKSDAKLSIIAHRATNTQGDGMRSKNPGRLTRLGWQVHDHARERLVADSAT